MKRYLDASFLERQKMRAAWDDELAPLDPKSLAKLRKDLLKICNKHGPKLGKSGTNYFYDEKEKRGKYIVGGSGSAKGGLVIALHGGGKGQGDAGPASGLFAPIASKTRRAISGITALTMPVHRSMSLASVGPMSPMPTTR